MRTKIERPGDHLLPLIALLMGCICLIEAASHFSRFDSESMGVGVSVFFGGAKLIEFAFTKAKQLIEKQSTPILW